MIGRCAFLRLTALLAGLALAGLTGQASSAGYNCAVPRALLCDSCAKEIAISLKADGSCRITFTPGGAAAQTNGDPISLNFNVEPPQTRVVHQGRRYVAKASVRISQVKPANCFLFNGEKYCE